MNRIFTFSRSLFDRVVALALLTTMLPTLALLAFLLRTNTDEPVLLADDMVTTDGQRVRSYRFRTTGRGSSAFQAIGRFLRSYSLDELPGLWAIARGQISLAQFIGFGRSK
jgi:sugar transferase EpsL